MSNSLKAVLLVFTGSGIGGVVRYAIQTWVLKLYPHTFPIGTFIVNITGCFLIGLFYALSEKANMLTPEWRLALTTGFCGGFTTFSTFANENLFLIKSGNYLQFGLYIVTSVVLGIAAVVGGAAVVKTF